MVLLETRPVKAALSAMVVKTDREDARGIARLLRMGWFRPVHRKSPDAREVRALLVGRKLLLQAKLRDVGLSIRVNACVHPCAASASRWARSARGRSRRGSGS